MKERERVRYMAMKNREGRAIERMRVKVRERENSNMSEMPLVPGPKEARFPHLRHAGPTATSGPYQHRQHRARHDYFRWTATAPGIGDRLNHDDHEYRSRSSVCAMR